MQTWTLQFSEYAVAVEQREREAPVGRGARHRGLLELTCVRYRPRPPPMGKIPSPADLTRYRPGQSFKVCPAQHPKKGCMWWGKLALLSGELHSWCQWETSHEIICRRPRVINTRSDIKTSTTTLHLRSGNPPSHHPISRHTFVDKSHCCTPHL